MENSANTQGNKHIDFEYDGDQAINDVAGERRHIKFGPASETDGQDGTYKYNGILTCLKANKLYSFSILIDNIDDILSYFINSLSNSNDIKIVDKTTHNKYIYNFTNSKKYLNKFSSIYDGNEDNYMLIIGHLRNGIKELNVEKIILIINNHIVDSFNIGGYNKYNDLLTAEEYLNLYYIEHFSLNIPKFIKNKYTPYEEEVKLTSPGTGETAEGVREDERDAREQKDENALEEATNYANDLHKEVMQEEINKFQDGEGTDGQDPGGPATGVSGTGEPPTVVQGPGEPATVVQGPGVPDTDVPGTGSQGGGKKLAKVKKNKKNKVV